MRSTRRTRDRPPLLIILVAAFAALLFVIPLVGLVWRAPWSKAWELLTGNGAVHALRLSLVTSLSATGIAIVLGVPLAWVQARVAYPGRSIVRALTTLPMVLPPVVGGIALLLALGRRGLVGTYLDDLGVHLPFHLWGATALRDPQRHTEGHLHDELLLAALVALGQSGEQLEGGGQVTDGLGIG